MRSVEKRSYLEVTQHHPIEAGRLRTHLRRGRPSRRRRSKDANHCDQQRSGKKIEATGCDRHRLALSLALKSALSRFSFRRSRLILIRNRNGKAVEGHGNEAVMPDQIDDLTSALLAERGQGTFPDYR